MEYYQLCELADWQCNTYTILENSYQIKITEFIKEYINFNNFEIIDAIMYIIPNFGLEDAFQFILENKRKIKRYEIIKLLEQCNLEYGKAVRNTYSDL